MTQRVHLRWRDFAMKILMAATCTLMFYFSSSQARAQNCKPDMSVQDKISKEQRNVWLQKLFATSVLGSLNSSSEVTVVGTIGRYGSTNALNVQLQKEEKSIQNAAFESSLRAVEGNQFFFGFKDGKPLSFTATSVGNETKAPNSVLAGFSGKQLVTTVVLSAQLSDVDLGLIKDTLTKNVIDSVRIGLAGGVTIEKSVSAGDGEKMRRKFACFFETMEKQGLGFSATTSPAASRDATIVETPPGGDYSATAQGKYLYKSGGRSHKPTDFTELSSDGKFYGEGGGVGVAGTYTVKGDVLTVVLPNGKAARGKFVGNRIEWPDGTIEEKQASPADQKPAGSPLTVEQIIQMVAAKVPDDVIIAAIAKARAKFDLTPEMLIKLKTSGVSDPVIRAMTKD
jgi:hypothetical protein